MRDRDAFGTALQTLRHRLRDGAYGPGAPLVIIELAQELHISATPVREALARLTGEGLVEERRGWGYGVWRLDREACEELYRLHLLYLEFALAHDRQLGRSQFVQIVERSGAPTAGAVREATEAVFAALVESGCHASGVAAHRSVKDRLAPLRLAEARIFDDTGEELQRLATALDEDWDGEARRQVAQYHQRRLAVAGALVRVVTSTDLADPNYIRDIA